MAGFLSTQPILGAALIFCLRVLDMSLDTLRVLFVLRGHKATVWVIGFFQATVFLLAITSVFSNLDNPLNVLGYAAGFATGNVVGIMIEKHLAVGHIQLSIISSRWGTAIAERLRQEGYAITEIPARGKDGTVNLLQCSVRRKKVSHVEHIINDVDSNAFITAEDIRPVRRGFWRA